MAGGLSSGMPVLSFFAMKVNPNTDIVTKMVGSEAFRNFLETYNVAVTVVLSMATILVLVLLFVNIAKLSSAADNDYKRREAINGIMVCLVCLAFVGGIDTIYAILLAFVFG